MTYKEILIRESVGMLTVTLNRPERKNSLTRSLLRELNGVLDQAEANSECRMIVLEGQDGVFCSGMDFEDVMSANVGEEINPFTSLYMDTIRRFTESSKYIISKVDGQVVAGGVGLVAASDVVIATSASKFSLSEAIWGLLPSMVLPYLIRRVGYQTAYRLTLTTLPITAKEALDARLVDEISEAPDEAIRRMRQRLMRVEERTVKRMKQYFRKLAGITPETEREAMVETSMLLADEKIREHLMNYVNFGKFPWNS